jgi:DNA (cytosine-5)-methyltransferase 1
LAKVLMRELALFAGAGGELLAGRLLGWRTVCAVEVAPFPRRVLLARQRDGHLDPFPIWDDIRTFDGHPWRGHVDIITGGFPCKDISTSRVNAQGIDGEQSGLWSEMARIIGEVRPKHVLVENTPALTYRGLGRVLGDLARLGFHARWGVLGAIHAGLGHVRNRIWIAAHADSEGLGGPYHHPEEAEWLQLGDLERVQTEVERLGGMLPEAYFCRKRDGVADWMDRLSAVGNGQVPAVVALAWQVLAARMTDPA